MGDAGARNRIDRRAGRATESRDIQLFLRASAPPSETSLGAVHQPASVIAAPCGTGDSLESAVPMDCDCLVGPRGIELDLDRGSSIGRGSSNAAVALAIQSHRQWHPKTDHLCRHGSMDRPADSATPPTTYYLRLEKTAWQAVLRDELTNGESASTVESAQAAATSGAGSVLQTSVDSQ